MMFKIKKLEKMCQVVLIVSAMVVVSTGCTSHKKSSDQIVSEALPKGLDTANTEELEIEQVTPEELYTAFKDIVESIANDSLYIKQIPSAIARDFDGDGLEELLVITGESTNSTLLVQMYEYEVESKTCYLSDEIERGIGSGADGAASYSLYEDEKGNYLLRIYNGLDFGDYETTISYKEGLLQQYSYRAHRVAREWVEKEQKDVFHHTYTYELNEKECTKETYEKALQNYKEVLKIASTPYSKDSILDETNGAEEVIQRYSQLTQDQEGIVVTGGKFIKDGKLSISSEDMDEFMSMNLEELGEVFGGYTESEYAEYIYVFPNYDFSVYSEINGEVMSATFFRSAKIMDLYFPEHAKQIADQLGRPDEASYNEHDDQENWIYKKEGYKYSLGLNVGNACLENITVWPME